MRDSIVFYKSFYDGIKCLPPEEQIKAYNMVFEYAFNGTEPTEQSLASVAYTLIKPQIDANASRFENGKKGGRPKKEKTEILENQENKKPMVFENEEIEKPMVSEKANSEKPNVNVNVNDNVNVNKKESTEKSVRFSPPTLEQVTEYIAERDLKVDPNRFIDFYESKGWMIGKNKMKDWRAAARSWDRGQRKELTAEATRQGVTAKTKNSFNNFSQRDYDYDELEKVLLTTNPERSENE